MKKPKIQSIYLGNIRFFSPGLRLEICVPFVDTKAVSGLKNGKISLCKTHVRHHLHTASF